MLICAQGTRHHPDYSSEGKGRLTLPKLTLVAWVQVSTTKQWLVLTSQLSSSWHLPLWQPAASTPPASSQQVHRQLLHRTSVPQVSGMPANLASAGSATEGQMRNARLQYTSKQM